MYKYGGEPSLADLLKAVEDLLNKYDDVYVIIDALDESNTRENLLRVLRDFATDPRFGKLNILASSREYIDIEKTMAEISMSVSIANPYVEEDIRLHVRSALRLNPRFERWPTELLTEVEETVSKGARGMYARVPMFSTDNFGTHFVIGFVGLYARLMLFND